MFSGLNFGIAFLRMTFLPEPKPNPGVPVTWRCPRRLGVDPCRILICWAVSSSEDETEVLEWGLWIMLRRFLGRGLFSEPFFDEFLLLTLVGFWNPSVGMFSTWFKTFLSSPGSVLVRGDIHKEWKQEYISVHLLSRHNKVENQTRFHFISYLIILEVVRLYSKLKLYESDLMREYSAKILEVRLRSNENSAHIRHLW